MALIVKQFSPVDEFERRVDMVIRAIRNSKRMPGFDRIRISGEKSHATWVERSAIGVPMHEALLRQLERLASDLGIEGVG